MHNLEEIYNRIEEHVHTQKKKKNPKARMNNKSKKTNVSGITNVGNVFIVRYYVSNKNQYTGSYTTMKEAVMARYEKELKYGSKRDSNAKIWLERFGLLKTA